MKELSLQAVVVRGTEHVETRVGDQTLMMSIEHGKYYSVDATAGRIWDLIERPIALSEIVSALMRDYDVSSEECEAQVKSFVGDLILNGLALEQ